jgi:hypothetical protein
MEEQYLRTLTPKEVVAWQLSAEQLQMRLQDTIGFKKWSNSINGNQGDRAAIEGGRGGDTIHLREQTNQKHSPEHH